MAEKHVRPSADELLAPYLRELPVDGLALSILGEDRVESTICVSDSTAVSLTELYGSLGEGPHWKTLQTGLPVLLPDVQTDYSDWPIFAFEAAALGVGALFSFPLTLGAAVVGVADMYRTEPGSFGIDEVDRAITLCALTTPLAVELAIHAADGDAPAAQTLAPELRREVQQATGMVLVQLDVSATDALRRLKAHAFSSGTTLSFVAAEVVARRLNFGDLDG